MFCMENFDFTGSTVSEGLGEDGPTIWDDGVFDWGEIESMSGER